MNGMVVNSSTNENNGSMNIVFKWCDMKDNRVIVDCDMVILIINMIRMIFIMNE